jgi:hypothetical protein
VGACVPCYSVSLPRIRHLPIVLRTSPSHVLRYRIPRKTSMSSRSQGRQVVRDNAVLLVSRLQCGRPSNCCLIPVRAETHPVSPGLKWLGFEAEHPSVTITDMNIALIYTTTPPYTFMIHCAAFNLQLSFLCKLMGM